MRLEPGHCDDCGKDAVPVYRAVEGDGSFCVPCHERFTESLLVLRAKLQPVAA